jgi:hypothetical protein
MASTAFSALTVAPVRRLDPAPDGGGPLHTPHRPDGTGRITMAG